MYNKTTKIFYKIDLKKTFDSMAVNEIATIKIAGENRDCAIASIYSAKTRYEAESSKRFTVSQYDNGTVAEVTRII